MADEQTVAPADTTPANTGADASVDADAIGEDLDMATLAEAIESAPFENPEPQTPEAQPTAQVPAAPATGTPPPAQAAATPPQAVQQQQMQQQPQQPQQVQQQPQDAAEVDPFTLMDSVLQQGRAQVIDAVADQVYKLSPEDLEGINTEPEKAIPKLLATVHVNAVQGVTRHIAQQMPAMVMGLMAAQVENTKREDAFFKAWPQLDREQHMPAIMQAGRVFKQMYPRATMTDFIRNVGAQVILAHGLHLQQPQTGQPQQVPPVQPQQQQVATPPPFVPAGAGSVGGVPTQPEPRGFWDEFVEVMRE